MKILSESLGDVFFGIYFEAPFLPGARRWRGLEFIVALVSDDDNFAAFGADAVRSTRVLSEARDGRSGELGEARSKEERFQKVKSPPKSGVGRTKCAVSNAIGSRDGFESVLAHKRSLEKDSTQTISLSLSRARAVRERERERSSTQVHMLSNVAQTASSRRVSSDAWLVASVSLLGLP